MLQWDKTACVQYGSDRHILSHEIRTSFNAMSPGDVAPEKLIFAL